MNQNLAYELYAPAPEFLAQPNVLAEREFMLAELRQREEIQFVARRAEQLAREKAEQMREDFFHGDVVRDFTPNDALGYQRRYLELEKAGVSQDVLNEAAEARRHNIRVGFGEAMQALTWDLPDPRCYRQTDDGTLKDGGYEIGAMFYNSLSPLNGDEELERRIYEAANFRAIEHAGRVEELAKNVAFIEISMRNTEPGASGYVEEIDKLQVRYSRFVDGPKGRELVMQPMYVDGRKFDEKFMNYFLGSMGVDTDNDTLTRTEILARPLMVDAREVRDVVEFVELMDAAASEWHGEKIFVGEVVADEPKVIYDELPVISKNRYQMIESAVAYIDAQALEMARAGAEPTEAAFMLDKLQKRVALEVCRVNPGVARVAFDDTTERLLNEANLLEAQGFQGESDRVFALAVEVAPDIRGCGAACNIREANFEERIKAARNGLKAYDLTGDFYLDYSSVCPKCSTRGLLRGGNGAVCTNKECGAAHVNGVVKEKKQQKVKNDEAKPVWWKSIREVQAEHQAKKAA